jgi:hypothetical protein
MTDHFAWLGWSVWYLAVHLLVYLVALRHLAAFRRERVMFWYHLGSACVLSAVSVLAAVATGGPAVAVALLSLHGFYSLSFLELWSLAEGGYSLSILAHVDRGAGRAPLEIGALQEIGGAKKQSRLVDLERLGLVERADERLQLTRRGRRVAAVLAGLTWLANLRRSQ